jgi:hypothetical protein
MAGSFGFEREHYDLSMQIGDMRLFPAVRAAGKDSIIAATGVSCRQQITQGTARRAVHPVTLLRAAVLPPVGAKKIDPLEPPLALATLALPPAPGPSDARD